MGQIYRNVVENLLLDALLDVDIRIKYQLENWEYKELKQFTNDVCAIDLKAREGILEEYFPIGFNSEFLKRAVEAHGKESFEDLIPYIMEQRKKWQQRFGQKHN